MTTIATERKILTLINVFTVRPEKQQQLINVLVEAGESVMKTLPGFISANLHRSLDGTKVTNYAQWESREAWEAMLHNPLAIPHLHACTELAEKAEPYLYEVVYIEALV